MKKQIMITLLVLLVCKITSFACGGPSYIYYNEDLKRNLVVLGRFNVTGPLLAFNLKGEILPGFDKITSKSLREFGFIEQDGIILRDSDDIFQFYDSKNQFTQIGESYASATLFSEGFAIVSKKNERLKIIDEKGNSIAFIGDYNGKLIELAEPFSDGLSAVKTEDDLWGFIDTKGNMVIPPQFTHVSNFNESYCVVEKKQNRQLSAGIINKKGIFTFPLSLNIKLAEKVSNGLIGFRKKIEAFGLMDAFGKEVLAPTDKINWISAINTNNMAVFSNGKNFGVINSSGEIIAKSRYTDVKLLDKFFITDGYGPGFIQVVNYKGKLIKTLPYTAITVLSNSSYLAYDNGEAFFLDKNFNEISKQSIISAHVNRHYGKMGKSARTDYFDIKKITTSPLFKLTTTGIAGLKCGDDVNRMVEVFELDQTKRINDLIDGEDDEIIIYKSARNEEERVYAIYFGELNMNEIEENEINAIDKRAWEDLEEDYEEEISSKRYIDTLSFITDQKSQLLDLEDKINPNVTFQYILHFSDFIKNNHFEEKKNSCNVCRLLGTSINEKAAFIGFDLNLQLTDKASNKAQLLLENIITELKSMGLAVIKKGQTYVITNPQQKDKKIGTLETLGDSKVHLSIIY